MLLKLLGENLFLHLKPFERNRNKIKVMLEWKNGKTEKRDGAGEGRRKRQKRAIIIS
jgi:hypothetical protein